MREAPAYRWRERVVHHSEEVEVTGSNPVQGLDSSSLYYYNNQPEQLPRQLDEQSNQQQPPAAAAAVDWLVFKDYLLKHYNTNTTKVRLCYAKRYYHVLLNEDASDLLQIESQQVRLNAMKSITLLARYLGQYDSWQQLRKRHNLKWTTGNESITAMQRFFNPELSLDKLLHKIREMIRVLPLPMAAVVRHAVLTGLRPTEACESARLIQNKSTFTEYYDAIGLVLQHYKFPLQFLRSTKKAFVSYVTLDNLQPIANLGSKTPTWNAIRLTCRRRGLNMDMRYCRKVHGSWLHKHRVSAEEVDFLQGRTSPSIFSRHYLTPDNSLKDRVLEAIQSLSNQLLL